MKRHFCYERSSDYWHPVTDHDAIGSNHRRRYKGETSKRKRDQKEKKRKKEGHGVTECRYCEADGEKKETWQ